METLQTYINTKEISHLLINVEEIKMLPSIFSWELSDICMENSPWQICLIIFIII